MAASDGLIDGVLLAPLAALNAVDAAAAARRTREMRANRLAFTRGALALHLRLVLAEAGADGPWVWSVGDAHPGNFATLAVGAPKRGGEAPRTPATLTRGRNRRSATTGHPAHEDAPAVVYDLADVDDEHPAPWHWDLLRLAASLPAFLPRRRQDDVGGLVALALARYREVMASVADEEGAHALRVYQQDLPPPLRELIARDAEPTRSTAHRDELVIGTGARARLRHGGDLTADPIARAELVPVLSAALTARGLDVAVLDLCARRGGGLASLGRRRALALVRLSGHERFVECKERRPSELASVLPALPPAWAGGAGAPALTVTMAGDPCQLVIPRPAWPLLTRTRCHARNPVDLDRCDLSDLRDLARLWATLLAAFHVRGWQALGHDPVPAAAAIVDADPGDLPAAAGAIAKRMAEAHTRFRVLTAG